LRALGVKGILIKAAEQGCITQLACKMPKCFCPEELGGAGYFEPVTEYSDWNPTHEHFPIRRKRAVTERWTTPSSRTGAAIRIDYSIRIGRGHARDLERITKAREEAIRRNNEEP
jgi:hypothetical protein